MWKKLVVFCICMLLFMTLLPMNVTAGDPENPDVKDRIYDVIGFLPISVNKRIDIVSAWFYEEESDPDNLHITLKILDLNAMVKAKTRNIYDIIGLIVDKYIKNNFIRNFVKNALPTIDDEYQALYAISWLMFNNNFYTVLIHKNPDGSLYSWVGSSKDDDDNIDNWYEIESVFDKNSDLITWTVPKNLIDNPGMGTKIRDISPHTHLRRISDSGVEGADLSKDLTLNAIEKNDYIIKY